MKKLFKTIALTLCAAMIFSFGAYAAEISDEVLDMYDRIQTLLIMEAGEETSEVVQKQSTTNCVFIGDSRTVGMQSAVGGDTSDSWSAKVSMGYDWMVSEGIPAVDSVIGSGTAVFILLGINDLGNVGSYASYINGKAAEWSERGATTYFCSVGPVGSTTVTNAQIESFNASLAASLTDALYLDLYSALVANGYSTADGLHYTADTYQFIYNYLKDYVS